MEEVYLGPDGLLAHAAPGTILVDMTIAADSARALGLDTPGLELAKSLYEKLQAQGGGEDGTQALFKLFR